ncbi:MAG: 50S ribosomal protein L6 [Planctomycetota bacterium]
MSRIGKQPVGIGSAKVSASKTDAGTTLNVDGPKGKLSATFRTEVDIDVQDKEVVITRKGETKFHRSYHGTARSIIANMVRGVTEGFQKQLSIVGVGYNAKLEGKGKLVLNIGFCHPVPFEIPAGIEVETPSPTAINIRGADKQVVGEFAARIRRVRPPEPYKGKGIKYHDEHIIRKAGKTFGSGD